MQDRNPGALGAILGAKFLRSAVDRGERRCLAHAAVFTTSILHMLLLQACTAVFRACNIDPFGVRLYISYLRVVWVGKLGTACIEGSIA